MSEAMNQHKQMAMGKKPAKGAGQGASPSYAKGGKVKDTDHDRMAKGGKVSKSSCNY